MRERPHSSAPASTLVDMSRPDALLAAAPALAEVARVVRPMFGPLGVDALVVDPIGALATNRRVRFAVWNFVN